MYEFTMTNVKDSCPLFRQKNVSVETKVKNLQLLIYVQIMGYKATATMEDLESAIKEDVDIDLENEVGSDTSRSQSIEEDTVSSAAKENIILPENHILAQKKEEFVLEGGFYIAQVDSVQDNKIWVSYLKPKQDNERTHWMWPDIKEEEWVEQDFLMEVYPALIKIDSKLSTKRNIVYELLNEEVINVFVQFS